MTTMPRPPSQRHTLKSLASPHHNLKSTQRSATPGPVRHSSPAGEHEDTIYGQPDLRGSSRFPAGRTEHHSGGDADMNTDGDFAQVIVHNTSEHGRNDTETSSLSVKRADSYTEQAEKSESSKAPNVRADTSSRLTGHPPTRHSSNTEEERLLGASRSRAPKDAVSINVFTFDSSYQNPLNPSAMSRPKKPGGGGIVRPRNDLGNTPGHQSTLRTQSSRGNNVAEPQYSPHFPDHDQDKMWEPNPKRRRNDGQEEIESPEIKLRREKAEHAYHHLGKPARQRSIESLDGTGDQSHYFSSQRPPRRSGSSLDAFKQVSAYRTIEGRMRVSKSYSANGSTLQTKHLSPALQDSGVTPKPSPRSNENDTVVRTYDKTPSRDSSPHVTDTLSEALLKSELQKPSSPQKVAQNGYETTAKTIAKLGDCFSSPTQESTTSSKRRRSIEDTETQPGTKKMRRHICIDEEDDDDDEEDELSRDTRDFTYERPKESNRGSVVPYAASAHNELSSVHISNQAIRVPGLAANSIPKTAFNKTKKKQEDPRKATADVSKPEVLSKCGYSLSYFMVSSMREPQRDSTMKLDMQETCVVFRKQDDRGSNYEFHKVPYDRIASASTCYPDGPEVRLAGSRNISDDTTFWCHLTFETSSQCFEFLSYLKSEHSIDTKQFQRGRVLKQRDNDEKAAAEAKTRNRSPEELSVAKSTKPSRSRVLETRQTLISQMQTGDDTGGDKASRGSRFARQPRSITYEFPSLQRATRSSNQVSTQPSESYVNRSPSPEKYSKIHSLGEPWAQDVKYPPTGRSKATVRYDDLFKLDEGECLNDNLIEFYMAYCHEDAKKNKHVAADSVYIFNSFFYSSLTQKTTKRDQINYDTVARWTRTVDLFTYDYVVIPINEDYHWYLAIICNLPSMSRRMDGSLESTSPIAVKTPAMINDLQDRTSNLHLDDAPNKATIENDEDVGEWPDIGETLQTKATSPFKKVDIEVDELQVKRASGTIAGNLSSPSSKTTTTKKKALGRAPRKYPPKEPIVITLDSLGSSHPTTVHKLRRYIEEEGKAKRSMESKIHNTLAGTDSTIPMQQNFVDCGVYTLAYFRKFIKDPKEFTRKFLQREMEAKADWGELDPSALRKGLRDLCQATYQEQHAASQQEKQMKREAKRKAKEATGKLKESNAPAQVEDKPAGSTHVDGHQAEGDPQENVKANWNEYASEGLEGSDTNEQRKASELLSEPQNETQDVVDQGELATSGELADLQARVRDETPRASSEPTQGQGAAKSASRTTRRAIIPEGSSTERDRPVEPRAVASETHTSKTPTVTKANPASVLNKSDLKPDDAIYVDSQDNSIILETNNIVCQEKVPDPLERPQIIEETPEPEIHPSSHSEPHPEPPLEPENVDFLADIQRYAEQHASEYGVPDIQTELFSSTQRKKSDRAHRSSPTAQRTSPRRRADAKRRRDHPNSRRASSNHTIVLD